MLHLKNNIALYNNINELPTWNYFYFQKYYTLWQHTNNLDTLEDVITQVLGYNRTGQKQETIQNYLISVYESHHVAQNEVSYAYFAFFALIANQNLLNIRFTSKEHMYEYIALEKEITFEVVCETVKAVHSQIKKQSGKYKYTSDDKSARHTHFMRSRIVGLSTSLNNEEYLQQAILAFGEINDYFLKQHSFIELSAQEGGQEYDWEVEFLSSFTKTYNALGFDTEYLNTLPVVVFFEKYDNFVKDQTLREVQNSLGKK